ncbi:tetratricopeptide repeat protein [Streptomyces sp. NBC_01176]|uniref:tetratricopeptide repeat protein n=1 Tax=Streptomyces sp. NBC_01176 TaxID=2903760 RepID=UPI002F906ED2|nr:tetratricopeptide repeat protein [Streptomyces sp. NBC_01176]
MVQVGETTGDVNIAIGAEQALYQVDAFPFGQPSLTVEQARAQPARLLQARYSVADFTGRLAELEQLAAWRDDTSAASILLLHGPGGQGKTRLASHFARLSRERGWQVLQARHASEPSPSPAGRPGPAADGPREGGPRAGVLLVVDYAERWPTAELLTMMTDATLQEQQARVLLLARPAGVWWQTLVYRLDRLDLPAAALPLGSLADGPNTDPETLFTAARDRFAAALDLPGGQNVAPPRALRDGSGFRQALSVHMAALAAVDAHRSTAPALLDTPERVSAYLLTRERDHWQTLHANGGVRTTAETLAHAVYTAALTGAVSYDHGRDALTASGTCTPDQAGQVLTDHAVSYPTGAADAVLEPLHPDRLAEDFLALTTPGHTVDSYSADPWAATAPQRLLAAAASSAGPGAAAEPPVWTRTAINALIAAAARWPHLAASQLAPLLTAHPRLMLHAGGGALSALADIEHLPVEVLEAVDAQLPEGQHTDLAPGAAAVAARLAPHRLAAASNLGEYLRILHTLEARQWYAGLRSQALESGHQVVTIWRGLAHSNPVYEPDLARSLSNLGLHLAAVGRWEDALATEREATGIRRRLAQADPATHELELVQSLINLGRHLAETGHPLEALDTTEQAVEHYERLAQADPAAHEAGLATVLHNLGVQLAAVGRHEEALTITQRAVDIRRRLVQASPATHEPDLAASLSSLGAHLAAAEQPAEALRAEQQAVEIYERLAQDNPVAYEIDLASSLNILGILLAAAGRHSEALAAAQRAVGIRRRLARTNPAAHEPDLAASLHNLGPHLAAAGQLGQALIVTEEVVGIRRRLARTNPAAYEPNLARSLATFARVRVEGGQDLPAALEAVQESAEIFRRLTQALPLAFDDRLRVVLDIQADILDQLGRTEEATRIRPPRL